MATPTITAEGRLTADPVMRFIPSGKAVTNFTLATSSRKKNPQTEEWEDGDKAFFTVTCWEALAESVAESLHKGDEVVVIGPLSQREYTTKDGDKRTAYQELRAYTVAAMLNRASVTVRRAQKGSQAQQAAPVDDPWGSPPSSDQSAPPF